jgi:hypothetical protein
VQYQLVGFYKTTAAGHLILTDFDHMDPAQAQSAPLLDFVQYVMDGLVLGLVEDDGAGGSVVFTGTRY